MTVTEALVTQVESEFFNGVIRQAVWEYYNSQQNNGATTTNDNRLIEKVNEAKAAAEAQPVTLIGKPNDFGIRPQKSLNPVWEKEKVTELLARGYEYTDQPIEVATSLDEQFWRKDA